ncbi:MAG: phosphoribosylglycinamide formyltransferase [Spirochaetaceae bacterium]|nr:phosphoribosylglycinamide formyltransferase [Spirochaetaceae bacterium]
MNVFSGTFERHKARIVVLVSGNGTNLQALSDAIRDGHLPAEIVLVVSSHPSAPALSRAHNAGIPAIAMPYVRDPCESREESRRSYDANLADRAAACSPDWIFLLGWMRILSSAFTSRFKGRILNLHPALPGQFPGTHAIERAWQAFRNGEIRQTGVMLHFVPDEGVDCGPLFAKETVPLLPGDTFPEFEARVHEAEHRLVAKAASMLFGQDEQEGGS